MNMHKFVIVFVCAAIYIHTRIWLNNDWVGPIMASFLDLFKDWFVFQTQHSREW